MNSAGTYGMTWTAVDLPADVIREATAQIYDQLADLGYLPHGPVHLELVARVPVVLHDDGPDDAQPWESRDAYAADILDVRALVAERFGVAA